MSFTHLQVRSGYSLMDSTITIDKLVKKATEQQFTALALTDENVLYGVIPFYRACHQYGIKPIIGMIINVKSSEQDIIQCILLAKTNIGYENLIKLSSFIQIEQNGLIEIEQLRKYTTDIIGILPVENKKLQHLFLYEAVDRIAEYFSNWQELFSTDDFYLGLADYGTEAEQILLKSIKTFQEAIKFSVVAINDVRYINNNDQHAFDCLQAMKRGKSWSPNKNSHVSNGHHLRSIEEMKNSFFNNWPEALQQTGKIAAKCNVEIEFGTKRLPTYPVPDNLSAHTFLERLCWENVVKKYDIVTDEITDRLTYELETIASMKYSDYFLIVWDFITYAKKSKIMVGPGRGSSAGSLVAYVLGITDVDPVKYDLLFERFLNPERITMPDIDIDFSDHRRDEVIAYVRKKYGEAHVAQIITFGTFAARSLLRELFKTMEIDQQDISYIMREIPVQAKVPLVEIVKSSPKLTDYIKQNDKLKNLFNIAVKLEGLPRHVSTHAAGVVISEEPLVNHVPLTFGANDSALTQFTMNDLEAIGLLKIDFLGLKNLTILERIIQSIYDTTGKRISLALIPNMDKKTFALLQAGKTNGIFQLESEGMQQVLRQLKPNEFADIVAVNALYRPGPSNFIPVYIDRKEGRAKITYPHPDVEPILASTYGVLVYQEQIMQLANQIAGFTFGQADILRRAVSKKQKAVMDQQRDSFIQGCMENGYDREISEKLFQWIVKFSDYGFPKSHAVAYSKISYQLAYLKAHYPKNFYAELLSTVTGQQDKLHLYINELREMQIQLAGPSVNKSFGKFTVDGNCIRMGLLAIKGIGNQVVKEIIRARKNGPFKHLFDFCMRVSFKVINRSTLELLILAGAFDETFTNRASLLASIDQAMEQSELFRDFDDQPSLFKDQLELRTTYVEMEDFSQMKKLSDEKELLGIYVSSHPIKQYRKKIQDYGYISLRDSQSRIGKNNLKSIAVIQTIKTIRTKRGDPMAFITLGDETAELDAVIFPELYRKTNRWIEEEAVVVIHGKVEMRNNRCQWLLNHLELFDSIMLSKRESPRLFIKLLDYNSKHALEQIKKIATDFPGSSPIIIYFEAKKQTYQLAKNYSINANPECIDEFIHLFGKQNVFLQKG